MVVKKMRVLKDSRLNKCETRIRSRVYMLQPVNAGNADMAIMNCVTCRNGSLRMPLLTLVGVFRADCAGQRLFWRQYNG